MDSKRWLALDVFKTIAVFVMVAWHLSIWWVNLHPSIEKGLLMVGVTPWPYLLQVIVAFSGHFVMSIPVIAGGALRFYMDKSDSSRGNKLLAAVLKRAAALACLGFVMNFLAFGIGYWHLWNTLQLISLSIAIITVFMVYSSPYLLAISGFLAIFSAPFIRNLLGNTHNYFSFMLIGDRFGDNIWAVFPWYGVVVYGFLFVHLYLRFKDGHMKKRLKLFLLGAGFFVIAAALAKNKFFYAVDFQYPWGPLLFQPHTLTVLAQLSVFTVLIIMIDFFSSRMRTMRFGIVNVFSKGILWIYVVHMIVGFRLIEFLLDSGFHNNAVLFPVMVFSFALSYGVGALAVLKKAK